MSLANTLSFYLGTFIVWGFLMAFLYNAFMRFMGEKKDLSVLISSFLVFISYFTSDHFLDFWVVDNTKFYIQYFYYDLATVFVIFCAHLVTRTKTSKVSYYVYCGLVANSIFFLAMHIDIFVHGNKEPWWLWNLYAIAVNIIDFIMICALIIGRDFLGILRLSRWVKSLFMTPKKALS
jgi:NhaP-type Na+/H+ or K+/H+ antiporter